MKKILANLIVFLISCAAFTADYDNSPFIPLWPNGKMPGKIGTDVETIKGAFKKESRHQGFEIGNVTKPTIQFFKADSDKPTAAVLISPGGAYRSLQYGHEGVDIARRLNERGISAFILKYRVPNEFNDKDRVFMDAQRAIRLIRHNAKKWNVDPDRLGVMRFSAGGHLSAWLSTNYDTQTYTPVDNADTQNLKPNFCALIYPAWLNTLNPTPENNLKIDSIFKVTKDTPPTFIVHNLKDKSFYHASIAYFLALEEKGAPADFHMFYEGGHGHGVHPRNKPVDQWWALFSNWVNAFDGEHRCYGIIMTRAHV